MLIENHSYSHSYHLNINDLSATYGGKFVSARF